MDVEHSEASEASDGLEDGPVQLGGSSTDTDVKVVVRVRPPVSHEQQPGAQMCVEHVGFKSLIIRTPTEAQSMVFNWVAGETTTQSEFFRVVGRPTVESCLSGFNSCIFAYGQTGSGKTHTMIGELPRETDSLPSDAGLIPRIFQYLWRRMPEVQASMLEHSVSKAAGAAASQASSDDAECLDDQTSCSGSTSSAAGPSLTWLVRCSMLEIHKEEIYDLLRPNSGSLNLREDIRKGVYVEGLVEKVVDNVQSLLAVLRAGIEVRQTASTECNAASSRSHCIFTCHVESRLEAQPGLVNVRSSRLHMVDLAGSERLRYGQGGMGQGEGSGQLLKETTAINTSLSVLGLVILRLTENQAHIPYRNSKLTFLLQDSIGGNAKTIIIANISPSEQCLQETLSTLKFATRARKLVNKAVVNEDTNGDAAVLRAENKRLKQELALARDLISAGGPGCAAGQLAAEEQLQEQQVQLQQALCLLSELDCRATELQEALEYSKTERAELEQRCLEDRQEIAALHVTLSQKEKEARSWRQKWYKLDKVAQSGRSSIDPTATAVGIGSEAASLQQPYSKLEEAGQLAHSSQASGSHTPVELAQASEVLSLLSAHLSQLVNSVCPAAAIAPAAISISEQAADPRPADATCKLRESLSELTAVCRPRLQQVPELGGILSSLELLSDWQQRLSPPEPASHTEPDCQYVAQRAVSGIPKASFVPIELHRQLEEERQLTAQLQKQVRKLQQQLGMAAEKSSSAVSKSCSSIICKTDAAVDTEAQLHTAFCTSADSVSRGATVALQPVLAEQQPQEQQPVVLQLRIHVTDNEAGGANCHAAQASTQPTPGTEGAARNIAALQQQVAALQEQLEIVTRQNNSLQGRMATARSALAAARCSTPSSLNSSRLPSPQPCFSPLRPLFGESIDEEEEEAVPSSWHRHSSGSGPGSPSTPVKQIAPASSPNAVQAGSANIDSLSQDEVWEQHHSEWQLHQQELQKRQQLTRAVHAAIKGAAGQQQQLHERQARSSLSPSGKPPLSPVHPVLAAEHTSSERRSDASNQAGGLTDQNTGGSSRSSMELLLLQQQTPPRLQLPQRWGTDVRASGGGLATFIRNYRLELQQLLQEADGDVPAQHGQQQVPDTAVEPATTGAEEEAVQSRSAGAATGASVGKVCTEGVHRLSPSTSPAAAAADTNTQADDAEAPSGCNAGQDQADNPASAEGHTTDVEDDDVSSQQQQPEQQLGGPAWDMADYEEEFRQLRQQLEELVVANSSLKAALQQRDTALADKEDLLEQQGHELVCTQELLQEIQQRLSLSEAQRAAAVAEHCDAIWAKGQVAGLRDLNEQLQMQLELQGQEVAELKGALERFMSIEAEPAAAEAFAVAAAALGEDHSAGVNTSGNDQGHLTGQANTAAAAAAAAVAAAPGAANQAAEGTSQSGVQPASQTQPVVVKQRQPDPSKTVSYDQQQGAAGSAAVPPQEENPAEAATAVNTALSASAQPTPSAAPDATLAAGSDAQNGRANAANSELSSAQEDIHQDVAALQADTAGMLKAPAGLSSAVDSEQSMPVVLVQELAGPTAAPAASSVIKSAQLQPTNTEAASTPATQCPSVAKKLRIHTSQLSAQPSNLEIAAEQAILLRHQLEAVGLQLQQKQLEAKLAQVRMQMDRLQQHQKVQLQQQQLQLQRYQRHSAHLQQEVLNCTTPKKQIVRHGGIGSVLLGLRAVTTGARLRPGQYNTWSPGRSPAKSPVGTFLLPLQSPVDQGGPTATGAATWVTPAPAAAAPRTGVTPVHASNGLVDAGSGKAGSSAASKQASADASADCSNGKHATLQADTCRVDAGEQPTAAGLGSSATAEQRTRRSRDAAIHTATAAPAGAAAAAWSGSVEPATSPSTAQRTTQAENPRSSCSSCCSDGSDSSSLGQCQEELTDLLAQLHALARDTHETSTFKAASASTLTPFASKAAAAGGDKACWPSASAVQMQTKLQVSSAFDLEATRGLMHAGAAVLELQQELNTAEKQRRNRGWDEKERARETSPLARSLLTRFNVAVPEESTAREYSDAAADPQLPSGAAAAVGSRASGTANSDQAAAGQQRVQSQEKLLCVLDTLAQQQEHLVQLLTGPADSPGSAVTKQRAACNTRSTSKEQDGQLIVQVTDLQQVHQQLLAELRDAKAALLGCSSVLPAQHQQMQWPGGLSSSGLPARQKQAVDSQQVHGNSSSLSIEVANASTAHAELEGGFDTPEAELSAAAAAANTAAATGADSAGSSRSPTRRQRSKQRELLRTSQETLQQQQGSSLKGDQQLLRDSCKEERLQQLMRVAKATDGVLDGAGVSSSWDAICQTEEQEAHAAVASKGTVRTPPALQLRVEVPDPDADAAVAATDQQEPAVVLELRGEIAKLQLQLHELKLRAQVAEGLRHRALQHLPRSNSSCSSRGEIESTDAAAFLRSSVDGAVASLSATLQRPPLLPPGLFSPRSASAGAGLASLATASISRSSSFAGSGAFGSPGSSTATAATSAAAAAAVAATPNAAFALTGKVQYLQSRCLAQHTQITQLKDQLQRQELLLRQQQLPPAAFSIPPSAAGVPSGTLTARGLHGPGSSSMFSPRMGASACSGGTGVFSPRVAQSSGGSGFFSPRVMSTPVRPQPSEQYGSPSSPGAVGMDGCSGGSPTKAAKSPLGVTAMALGGIRAGEGSRLSSSSSITCAGGGDRRLSHIGLVAVPEDGALQKKASAGSSRRQSLGSSTAKGLKVAIPGGGRMRLAAMKGSMRRQSMG